ncbi:MAG: tetratricopeptide repeat protein [Anaerolineae bacterium]|nr:tetratricopeptide repeat protein [Anaerolineae bacterium]
MALEDRIRLPALNLIHRRPRLLNMLAEFIEAGHRLITVYAPGGYGKSILLADFAQTIDLPVCWCSLEPADRDPTSFLILLAHSIIDRFHQIEPDGLLRLVQQGDTQVSVHRIATLLADVGPHLIIVDDYHKAVSAGMSLTLNRLLEQLPETSTVIVAARGDMALETGQIIDLLLTERVTGLSEEELRFTPAELQRVMRKRFGRQIDQATAEEIAQTTDGNIAQILLTGHLMHAEGIISRLPQRLGDDRAVIYSYLAEEVFDKQPPDLQQFMLYTSVLPDMTAELCNELLEITDAQTYLEQLVRKDLFITQVGAGFRYHDLFTEFLRSKLAESEELYHRVATRAGHLLAEQSRFEEAVMLFLSMQAWDETVDLLETQGRGFYDTGRALTLNNWLSQIPKTELARRPRLLLLQGQILNYDLSELEAAFALFRQAEDQFLKQDDLVGAAEAQVWQSDGLRMMGRAKEALVLARKGLEQLETLKADDRVMAWAIKNRGSAHGTAGNLSGFLADLRRALALFEKLNDVYNIGLCHHNIGIALERQGHVTSAGEHFRQAIQIWETLGNDNALARTLNSLGVSLYAIGHYGEALRQFNESLDVALKIGATGRAAFAQAGIGDVYLDLQQLEQAVGAYMLSTEYARQAGMRSLEVYNTVKRGECFFQQQNLAEALRLANQAREIAAEMGLVYEKGLATTLQAKIYLRRAEQETCFRLFAEALSCFAENDVLEQAKVRLWWGYSLLLDFRASSAWEQLQEAIRLARIMDELLSGLGITIAETQQLLLHFRHRSDTPAGIHDDIDILLKQNPQYAEASKPSLQVFAFGPPAMIVANEYEHFFGQRGRIRKVPEFFLYLILETQGSGCRWNEISVALWPDLGPARAKGQFHSTLRRLRQSLGQQDYVIVRDDYYQINNDYLEWCDALAFDVLFERALAASPEEALTLQLELISLYRGEFLAGFELGEWGNTRRTQYEIRFLRTVKLASDQLLADGDPQQALEVINKGLSLDYFREDLHRNALTIYAQLGLYDDLVSHYQELGAILEQELGVPPEPETQHLYEQLTAKDK